MKQNKGPRKGLNLFEETSKYLEILPEALRKEIKQLSKFIGQERETLCRRAPSIVTRSEVELFGISSPRFATRIYFEGGGFANCRRIEHLVRNIPKDEGGNYGERYSNEEINNKHRNLELKDFSQQIKIKVPAHGCIADCVLALPERHQRADFRCVQVNNKKLLEIYTEFDDENQLDKLYTPYVKSNPLGGGLCAQAACFMSTMALLQYATSLCGISEITVYAHPEDCRELCLSGLRSPTMKKYFQRVGLAMTRQTALEQDRVSLSAKEKQYLARLLRGYLHSNMPIIFPVDSRKLAIAISKDGYTPDHLPPENQAHTVVLIGYCRENDYFLLHDPGGLPYVTVHIDDLAKSGCKRDGKLESLEDTGVFMPVTPGRVKMPLGSEGKQDYGSNEDIPLMGLTFISSVYHEMFGQISDQNSVASKKARQNLQLTVIRLTGTVFP